jgi:hypothetical protein
MTLARTIATEEYKKYLELVNAGAHDEAAASISAGGAKPVDVLMNLFQNHVTQYTVGGRGVKLIEQILNGKTTAERWARNARMNTHGAFEPVKDMVRKYAKTGNGAVVKEGSAHVQELSTTSAQGFTPLKEEYNLLFKTHSQAVTTLLARFEEMASRPCPCCSDPESKPTTLVTCCLQMVCPSCLVGGGQTAGKAAVFQFRQTSANHLVKICGLCQTTDSLRKPIQTARIVKESGEKMEIDLNEWFKQAEVRKEMPLPEKKLKTKGGPKNTALVKICKGLPLTVEGKLLKVTKGHNGFAAQSDAIISGTDYIEPPADANQIVVFGESPEALRKSSVILEENGITCRILGGSAADIAELAREHRDGKFQVLLICRKVTCQGLNLQHCRSAVFMHQLGDETAVAQFIGRIQRAGRLFSGTVYRLLYQNEA